MLSRRHFIVGSAAAVATFRNDTISKLISIEPSLWLSPEDIAKDEGYWTKVRAAFDIEESFLYLNNGGICPAPRSVRAAEQAYMDQAAKAPAYYIYRKQEPRIEEVRKRLAKLFKASPDEIAVMPNASQGLFTAVMGTPMVQGDVVVTTNQDYPRIITAIKQRERRDRITPKVLTVPEIPPSTDAILASLSSALTLKPKLVCIPRVGYLNGTVFPAKEIVDQFRGIGTLTLVDGAHAIGQLPDTAASVGSDFYACCLHKWILGPTGSGFLYVRKDHIPNIWPLNPADESLDKDIRKFEQFGTRNSGILLAVLEALDAHEAIGQERKSARLVYLRKYLSDALKKIPGLEFGSALSPELGRALLAVRLPNIQAGTLATWLMSKHKIFVTTTKVGSFEGIRITPQIFTSLPELDRFIGAMTSAVKDGLG